jgi:large subunit ribosomal protein L10
VNRAEKSAAVESMAETFRKAPHVFITDFRGMTVNQSSELRRRIRRAGGTYRVLKNRLAKRAAAGTAAEKVAAHLVGPRAVACHPSDPVAIAKVLSDFSKENPQLQLVAAVVDARSVVAADGIKAIATLPGLPELRAQLLALFQTPAVSLVRLLSTPGSQVARALDARREKLETGGA